jgi:transposase-like protein
MPQARRSLTAAQSKDLKQLGAAVDAYRDGHPRRRLSHGLRAAVVAALEAGAPVRAVREACKVSASQITRWRQTAARSGDASASSTAASASPRVLSVVDAAPREDTLLDSEIELRIGGWHVSLRRVVQ